MDRAEAIMERLTVKRADGRWAIANNNGATPLEQTMKIPIVIDRLAYYEDLEEQGRLVVLPFQMGKTLLDCSDPERPEPLSNFRVALAYDHYGIVFHQPLNIFLENVQKGYIRELSEAAEQALEGGGE